MTTHRTGTRDEWLAARRDLLEAEKALTRMSDDLARRRQALPWVPVEEDYRFHTESGPASLADLFGGRSQLMIYHFMFGRDWSAGCPSCSAIADGFNGVVTHLINHDVAFWAVSIAPIEKLLAYRNRMDWSFPWASSAGSDFNADFNVAFEEAEQLAGTIEYNYRREPDSPWREGEPGSSGAEEKLAASCGTDLPSYNRDRPGLSSFARDEAGTVYHAYSAYARGLDAIWGMYPWLDRTPKGRNEGNLWWRRHDEYAQG